MPLPSAATGILGGLGLGLGALGKIKGRKDQAKLEQRALESKGVQDQRWNEWYNGTNNSDGSRSAGFRDLLEGLGKDAGLSGLIPKKRASSAAGMAAKLYANKSQQPQGNWMSDIGGGLLGAAGAGYFDQLGKGAEDANKAGQFDASLFGDALPEDLVAMGAM
jgi:hypothetical protein